jgi:hypothetical protein
MKKLLVAAFLTFALVARGADSDVVASLAAASSPGAGAWSPDLSACDKITVSLYAVNASTGLADNTATSTGTFVIEFKENSAGAVAQFPKPGDDPITNPGGGCADPSNCPTPARIFRFTTHQKYVRCNALTLSAGKVNCDITYHVGGH